MDAEGAPAPSTEPASTGRRPSRKGKGTLLLRWEVLAAAIALVILVGLPAAAFGVRASTRFDDAVDITLKASAGRWSPDTIHVRQGDRVRLRLTSGDVVHGFYLPDFGIRVDEIYPGRVRTVDFVADRAGTFRFECTVWCSVDHPTMRGELVVEPIVAPESR